MSTPSKAVTSADCVAMSKLAFSCLGLKESRLHWPQISLAPWILSQGAGELKCLDWPLCWSNNIIWIHCLKSRLYLSSKMIIPLKCNLRIKVQMYQKQQKKGMHTMQETRAGLVLESLQKIHSNFKRCLYIQN